MTWARAIELLDFEVRGWLYPDELSLIYRTDCSRRTAMLTRRVKLARMEAAAWRSRLDEERLIVDTAIRSMHIRIDNAEQIVEAARVLVARSHFLPGDYRADMEAFARLVELLAERDSNQQSQPMERSGS